MDFILESLGARWSVEESTNVADGGGSGERLATTAADAMEMPGAMARATESSKADTGAANVMSEFGA